MRKCVKATFTPEPTQLGIDYEVAVLRCTIICSCFSHQVVGIGLSQVAHACKALANVGGIPPTLLPHTHGLGYSYGV